VQFETIPSTPAGDYRLVARGAVKVSGQVSRYEWASKPFEVWNSRAVTASARLTADFRLALDPRFPPNPTLFADDQNDVIGNYRVRDPDADPKVGARALPPLGATASVMLLSPGASVPSTVNLSWNDAQSAWLSEPLSVAGQYQIEVAPNTLVDRHGNDNVAMLRLNVTR
jgi:hypothetical protein